MLANHLLIRQAVKSVKFNSRRVYIDRHRRLKQHYHMVFELEADKAETLANQITVAIYARGYENPIKHTVSRAGRHYIRIVAPRAIK